MARWKYPFVTRSPDDPDNSTWEVGIEHRDYESLQKGKDQARFARIILVKAVLDDPTLIIRGWTRPDKGDCFAYAGEPKMDYRSLSIEVPPPPGQLFLVFILPSGTIDLWTWRMKDTQNPLLPQDVKGTIVWPLI
ncbi:MAG: hypothetical protein KY475_14585 [Planctomycetes bacterium]|nr:hypothetical protein [Planctomycetota bacterium]